MMSAPGTPEATLFSKAASVLVPDWDEEALQSPTFKYDTPYKVVKGFHTAVCLGLPVGGHTHATAADRAN